MGLVEKVLNGDKRALARLITRIENDPGGAQRYISDLYSHTGKARIIGVTGPPGCGKSTIVDKMARILRERGRTVGIVAVDPTSPFTGGALLGDRIRMADLAMDEGVFIRSMGSRGYQGGLARATGDVVRAMDAFGMDVVIVEAIGAGQAETDIVRSVHTLVVVTVPGLGDDIQAFKAGIMEIGDVFVVNKADRDGADRKAAEIGAMLDLDEREREWTPPVMKTVATTREGVEKLVDAIDDHVQYLETSGLLRSKEVEMGRRSLKDALGERLDSILGKRLSKEVLENYVRKVASREVDPHTASEEILGSVGLL